VTDHTKTIIRLTDVTFSYGKQPVLKNVNLDIHKGDYLGIIGPNGGGKTTLIKIIVGLLAPQVGSVTVLGQDIRTFSNRSLFGYVPQRLSITEPKMPMTVREVVNLGRYQKESLLARFSKKDISIVDESLKQVGILDLANTTISSLSGGQLQRVFIAKALAGKPEILLLDEPTVGVDVATQEQFYTLLKKLNQELDLTLLLVSHDMDVVAHEATELACINQTLVYHGIPKEFIHSPHFDALYGKEVRMVIHGH
jgi:zinc transport system ATP-binding protein